MTIWDVSHLRGAEREDEARGLAREEAATAVRSEPRAAAESESCCDWKRSEHVLLLTMHHIVSDGWSMGVLIREVGALYRPTAGRALAAGGVADPVCGLRGLAEGVAAGRGAGARAGVLAEAVGGSWRRWSCRPISRGRRCRVIEGRGERFVIGRRS